MNSIPVPFARAASLAGIGSALVLLVNAAKRSGLIETTPFTQLVAPLAQIFALALVAALYFGYTRRDDIVGLTAYLINSFALATLVGVEFVINLVFAELPTETIGDLRAGPLGIALTVASMTFLVGTLFFVAIMLRNKALPSAGLILYGIGAIPVSLRAFVPEIVLDLGLAVLAIGIGWIAIWLFRNTAKLQHTNGQ